MFALLFILSYFGCVNSQNSTINLKVGMLVPLGGALEADVGYRTSVGAIIVALNKAIEDKIYDPTLYNITFTWNYTQCSEDLAVGYASKMIKYQDVSAIFGPTCISSAELVGALAAYTNTPVFLWSTVSAAFIDRKKFPTVIASGKNFFNNYLTLLERIKREKNGPKELTTALANTLKKYNWTQIGFLFTTVDGSNAEHVPFCRDFAATMLTVASTTFVNISTYNRYVVNATVNGFQSSLSFINTRARVIVTCLETKADRQNLMLAAAMNNMIGEDYVYLFIQTSASGFGSNPFWEGSPSSAILKEAAKSVLILDKYAEETPTKDTVNKKIVDNIRGWPFYCKDCSTNANASNLAFYLGDAFYTYLLCLNWTYTKYGPSQLTNTTAVLQRLINETLPLPSIMGNNFTNLRGFRSGRYALWGLDPDGVANVYGISYTLLSDTGADFTTNYVNEATSIWAIRGGKKPLSTPICGFSNICPPSPLIYASVVVASIFLFVGIVIGLCILVLICQRQQRRRLNALWQINFNYLQKPEDKNDPMLKSARSIHSFASQNSSQSNYSFIKKATEHTDYFIYDGELVVAQKHPYHGRWSFDEEEEFRKMRKLDNAKLNRFLGVSVSQSMVYTIWGYCDRGNIIEVIKTHSFRIDSYIMIGMMKEIADGLLYIHSSLFVQHGNLNAYNCVVGDRFDVKIQMFGCSGFKSRSIRRQNSKCALYVAPEHLQGSQSKTGSQAGDIYSFGILASVILTMKSAYAIEDITATELIEETVRKVISGRYPPFRPSLETDDSVDIHPELFKMVRSCWSELPLERPKIEEVREILIRRSGNNGKSLNLMDHMFALMENSAAELEQDVKMRTIELQNEQKKADILLYRIMPREAADKLKLGQLVESEVFEQASVFFSDIVSFTVLASKSTPLQIINFLNDVYTLADSVLDRFDVYKVETIGDGMHVVSGVPKRNGHAHVKEITNMAIDFQRAVKTLRLSHLPDQQILMRVGIHSGIVVAGIVGMTNPRYIVLGDTVNLSAKMEAAGKAGRIHITKETKTLINQYYPNQFHIFDRGETLIKGIGPMNTYWVALPEEAPKFQP